MEENESLETEIQTLETEIDKRLEKSLHFNQERVSGKSIFDIELLRVKIHSKAEHSKSIQIATLLFGAAIGFSLNLLGSGLKEGNLFSIIIFVVYIVLLGILVFRLSNTYKRTVELDSYGIGLIDMLLERKRKLKSDEYYGNRF